MQQREKRKPSRVLLLGILFIGVVVVVGFTINTNRPDRPVKNIVPGSSSSAAFVVQVIRPRMGLPLGGLLPPQLFGIDKNLVFDSSLPGAEAVCVGRERIEFKADKWKAVLILDDDGHVSPDSYIIFEFIFEDRLRKVRCSPGEPVTGKFEFSEVETEGQLSGSFDIELARCVDAETGQPLGWPPQPLVLHGSFDRLSYDDDTSKSR